MELHICTSLGKVSHTYYSCYPKWFSNSHLFRRTKLRRRLNSHSRPLRVVLCSEKVSTRNGKPFFENQEGFGNSFEDFKFVEVIGIGSRKDAVLDFCLDSPLLRSSLRFWNILIEDSVMVQLQQRVTRKDIIPSVMEAPSALQSCSKAIVLVATAAYGLDHIRVVDILKGVKSANRLVVAIILKPFSFEGRRRQVEVKDLVEKLQEHTNFCIVIDTDVLLEKDLVTLDEALKTANTAVLMAINAISVLVSENQKKLLDSPQNYIKEVNVSEAIEILQCFKEARIGFGAGCNFETSIMQAVFNCPFLSGGLKDLGGIVVCILASSAVVESSDVNCFLHTFRQTTECRGGIIISLIHDSSMEPNLIVATVIAVGHTRHHASQEISLLSRLGQHFPLIFNLLRRHHPKSDDTKESCSPESPLSEVRNSPEPGEMENIVPADSTTEGLYSAELQTLLNNNDGEIYYSSSEQEGLEFSETMNDSSDSYHANIEGVTSFQMEPLSQRNFGQRYRISDEWSNEGDYDCGATPMLDSLGIYKLPIGVKLTEELKSSLSISNTIHHQEKVAEKGMYRDAMPDAGFEAVSELYDNASTVSNGHSIKKQGVLSVRAASMLEAEHDSQKKWNPMVEMKYRGGIYKGRCQGGLPEGKGRLSLKDGSIYDGTWHYGKRSGLGTFYFSNGDVYQGSWRDDIMHGKGWLYFHTGDRWFVNFWKGKAYGEGRFYSKFGEIFFGHFKDGWRHGHFLCIHVDGTRYLEIWNEGILQSWKQLDVDAGSGSGSI